MKNGNLELLEMSIEAGAAINVRNVDGDTALMLAVRQGHAEIMEMLKAAGATEKAETFAAD